MKVIQVYNQQRSLFGGEEAVVNTIRRVLERNGHMTSTWVRSSRGCETSLVRKAQLAMAGVYNASAYREMQRVLTEQRPDVVHVHSVYPNFSPSILAACNAKSIPAVFHVHCQILTCPNWYHLRDGKICTLCFGGREQWCVLTNCRGSLPESAAYAMRSFVGRRLRLFEKNVAVFIAVSHFLRERLIAAGYPGERIDVVQNAVGSPTSLVTYTSQGEYVGYAGRLSIEKGVDTLVEAARISGLPVKVAGDGPQMATLRAAAPRNVEFLGRLDPADISVFYRKCRFILAPSRSYEGFPLAVAEAMMHGKPAIASRIGALPELIEDGVRGLLVDTDDAAGFARAMRLLWHDERLCAGLGAAAKAWAEEHCHEDVFYARLMTVYRRAIASTAVQDERSVHSEETSAGHGVSSMTAASGLHERTGDLHR